MTFCALFKHFISHI